MSGALPRVSRAQGALGLLAVCFALSALMRAGEVAASLPGLADDGFGNAVAERPGRPTAAEAATDPPGTAAVLIAELRETQGRLAARARILDDRARALEAVEARLTAQFRDLTAARARLGEMAVLVDDAAAKDVRHLAEMYQRMKPKQASQIFDQMAPSFAAGFLAEMRPEAAALILGNMAAERAYAVSLLLAGRNLDPRE